MRRSDGMIWRLSSVGLLLVGLCLAGCKEQRIGARYRAERDFWSASRLERGLQMAGKSAPEKERIEKVARAYEEVLKRNPAPDLGGGADTSVSRGIAQVRGQAELRLVPLQQYLGQTAEVERRLADARRAYTWDLNLATQFYLLSVDLATQKGDQGQVAALYQEMVSSLPGRLADGSAVVPVLDAPIRAADALVAMNHPEEALAELDRAEVYYRTIIQEDPGDQAAAFALLQLGILETRRGRFDKAAENIEQARRSAASQAIQPRILFALGQLQQEGRRDLEAAARAYRELVERFPEDPVAPEAMVRRAACLGEMGRTQEALEVLDAFRTAYPRDKKMSARATLIQARLLERSGNWQDAASAYRSLSVDFPTSEEAITAPFEVVAHYRRLGEADAARTVLERAIEEYDRLKRDYPGTPLAWQADERAAAALGELGRWSEAVERLAAMPDGYPKDPRNPMLLVQAAAISSERVGDRERAASLLEGLATRYPESPLAARAREEAARLRGR